MSTVEWRPVLGFEGIYEVSNTGIVRSVDRIVERSPGPFMRKGIVLRPNVSQYGRLAVLLRKPGGKRRAFVHVLVLEAFVGPRPDGLQCCHYDDNPLNNHLSNLRWDTDSANKLDSVRNGTHARASRTHCKRGHEYTPDNTYFPPEGGRRCRICCRAAKNRCMRRQRAVAA